MTEFVRESGPGPANLTAGGSRRWLLFTIPAMAFSGVAAVFISGLRRDPVVLPSVLIGWPVPSFTLPPVQGRTLGLSSDDLKAEIALVNVFASCCTACIAEHPKLMRRARERVVSVHGLNYKDSPAAASAWFDKYSDPYFRTGADLDGRVSIDWGVYSVPETFVVGHGGRVHYRHVGPLTEEAVAATLLPPIEKLRR